MTEKFEEVMTAEEALRIYNITDGPATRALAAVLREYQRRLDERTVRVAMHSDTVEWLRNSVGARGWPEIARPESCPNWPTVSIILPPPEPPALDKEARVEEAVRMLRQRIDARIGSRIASDYDILHMLESGKVTS